jgi:adenine specific DNA methylase Mod/very-short-patch-repair endonuclease
MASAESRLPTSDSYNRLQRLLAELFQLDQAELDFGIYRIMNTKREEITCFLDHDLLPQVRETFQAYEAENRGAVEAELAEAIEKAKALGVDPETTQRVKEIRARLAQAVDVTALENEVYSHLYNFFRRYYSEGDFLSLRRYKEGVYAIPYEGEEVKLHWANHDQYYIKTSEYLRNYTFKLPSGKRVHFKLVEADTEKDNNRAQNGNERRFIYKGLTAEGADNAAEIVFLFEFTPHPEKKKQAELNTEALERVRNDLQSRRSSASSAVNELFLPAPTEKNPNRTLLEKHLTDYTARNTFDYFIHKDLGGFLRRELDFYIKNEVMHLDDIESETAPRVEQYLAKIKAIRRIAHKIIDFLAQLENFQKKLWLKKKFVVETQYCITLDRIFAIEDKKTRDWLIKRIIKNDAQREEWVRLFAIDELPDYPWRPPLPSPRGGEGQGEGHKPIKSRTKAERSELLKQFAREMRHAPTDAEQRLWYFLRDRRLGGYKFRRQHPVGNFIADFACIEGRLIVELDGGQHAELFQKEKDETKARFFEERGFRVLRFWNNDVLKDTQAVLETIVRELEETPHPNPLPNGERETQAEIAPSKGERGFLEAHPTLVVDTRHFDEAFKLRLLAAIPDIDEETDGLLIKGENFQALNLLMERYRGQVKCIYIDPPYNTGSDGFPYRDKYQHSSWLSFMLDRITQASRLLSPFGAMSVSIDDTEVARLCAALDMFGPLAPAEKIIWKKRSTPPNDKILGAQHEYALVYVASDADKCLNLRRRSPEQLARYRNPDNHPKGPWMPGDLMANVKGGRYVESLYFPIRNPNTGEEHYPSSGGNWRYSRETIQYLLDNNEIWFGEDGRGRPKLKRFLCDVKEGITWTTLWDFAPLNTQGSSEMAGILGSMRAFENPKPVGYVSNLVRLTGMDKTWALDYFAGSGTTGHAVINLNREDGGRRKFILVEMGDYFDTVLVPRIKKVIFTPEWKDGKPKRMATPEEVKRSPRILKILRLESYEDTLNNLELQRTEAQQRLLEEHEGFREDYVLRYMLDVESRGSASLLNIDRFEDPFNYQLDIATGTAGETRPTVVDLVETFNYLLGLRVKTIDHIGGVRVVTGTNPQGERVLILWRKTREMDNDKLDDWFKKQGYNTKDQEYDVIYVNGDNNLENLRKADQTWKVRLLEEEFRRLMFDVQDV